MHTNKDYTKSPAPSFDAVEDIKKWFGKRWAKTSRVMAPVKDVIAFRLAANLGGVAGYPVEAWYDLYFGKGAFAKALAAVPEDAARQPEEVACRWFLQCDNVATSTHRHPILGDVPICERCAAKVARLEGATS